jgi:cyclopropane fatty-acyl-phospholipid synthase-like methyltransferase
MMVGGARLALEKIYARARRAEDLPWYREEPWPLLRRVVEERERPGRALDVGCGAGVYSSYLAQRGYRVTGVDYLERPLQMARERAEASGVEITLIHADVCTWEAPEPFDLILDSGCLHALGPSERPTYRCQLLKWLRPRGDYVLIHFGKRHPFDWRPMGPRRRRREEIVRELSPELVERAYSEQLERAPLPIGPVCLIGSYWFQRV